MNDIVLKKKCKHCGSNITLMESCRGDMSIVTSKMNVYLVERCLACGVHPITEIARLANDQSGLNDVRKG